MAIIAQKLTPLEQAIVGHISRYRLTVETAVANRVLPPPHDPELAKGLLGRLQRLGIVGRSPLYGQEMCYWLARSAAEQLELAEMPALAGGVVDSHVGPLAETAKVRAFGMLAFCCFGKVERELLTREELAHAWPSLIRPGLPLSFYRDVSQPNRLGFARVDLNGSGKWDRIVQKVVHDGMRFLKDRDFRAMTDAGDFEIALITATNRKVQRIETAWGETPHVRSIPLRVVAVPELVQLVGVPKHQLPW